MFDWFNLFNKTEFLATGLVARTLLVNLEGRGVTRFDLTVGNTVGVTYLDAFLPVEFLGNNPYEQGDYAVWLDPDTADVWFGFAVEDA